MQRALGRLWQWTRGNFKKFNKGKYRALRLGRVIQVRHQYKSGIIRLQSSSVEKFLGAGKPPKSPRHIQSVGFTDHLVFLQWSQDLHTPSGFRTHLPRHPSLSKGSCMHSCCFSPSSEASPAATLATEGLMAVLSTLLTLIESITVQNQKSDFWIKLMLRRGQSEASIIFTSFSQYRLCRLISNLFLLNGAKQWAPTDLTLSAEVTSVACDYMIGFNKLPPSFPHKNIQYNLVTQ